MMCSRDSAIANQHREWNLERISLVAIAVSRQSDCILGVNTGERVDGSQGTTERPLHHPAPRSNEVT